MVIIDHIENEDALRKRLYSRAVEFYHLAPWEWIGDKDVFGIEDPKTKNIGFCSIMGEAGICHGMAIYMGEEGLGCLDKIFTLGSKVYEDEDIIYQQNNINLLFGGKEEILPEELTAIKRLGFNFRGRKAWPIFRRFLPGYFPWYLTYEEMEFTTIAIEQAMEVALTNRYSPEKIGPSTDMKFLIRTFSKGKWSEKRLKCIPSQPSQKAQVQIPLPDGFFDKGLAQPLQRSGEWEIDIFYTAPYVNEENGKRPYFPQVMAVMDCDTDMILGLEMAVPDCGAETYRRKFMELLNSLPIWPTAILYKKPYVGALLSPIAENCRISMKKRKELPLIKNMRLHMNQYLQKKAR